MKILPTGVAGVVILDAEPHHDDRGFFARTWCRDELSAAGLDDGISQCSISFNERRGTVRGLHWQRSPWEETKIVRCTRGRIWDVALDLRADSATYLRWTAVELSAENRRSLYIPKGVAHGFQSLDDRSEVYYMISESHHPESASGVRWNDPAFGIAWPIAEIVISDRDASYPDFVA